MPFEKGQSGNPGGRPKENAEVRALAREYTAEAIEKLAEWMRSDNAKASISACISLLDRAWGRPAQPIEGEIAVTDKASHVRDEIARELDKHASQGEAGRLARVTH